MQELIRTMFCLIDLMISAEIYWSNLETDANEMIRVVEYVCR